jgi:hypothetical protein
MGPSGGNSLLDTNDMYYEEDDEEGEQGGSIEGRYTEKPKAYTPSNAKGKKL